MKKVFFNSLIILFLAPVYAAFGQGEVYISKSVLKTADWAEFKYKDVLKKSIAGDQNAILQFFKFSNVVDGAEGIDHAVTCLELIPLASDRTVAGSLVLSNAKLKKLVLDRITLAQGKTQKAELRQAIKSWAPATWAILNNEPMPAPPIDEAKMLEKVKRVDAAEKSHDADQSPAVKPADSGSRQ